MIWVIADQHFGCNIWGRSESELINNHNSCVGENDEVYHLGDFIDAVCAKTHKTEKQIAKTTKRVLSRLNGKHILIRGNHDVIASLKVWDAMGYETRSDLTLVMMGYHVHLSHTPVSTESIARTSPKHIYLHGHTHTHNGHKFRGRQNRKINMCCDLWEYKPTTLFQVLTERKAARTCKWHKI